jgi:hypothetical protein
MAKDSANIEDGSAVDGSLTMDDGPRDSSLAGVFPVRAPVWWARCGEAGPHPELPGVTGRFVVLRHTKSFRKFEGFLAKIMRAPRELRRPLDDLNSLLWELCDGHRPFEEICSLMDGAYGEKVAPAAERTEAALRQLGERGFLMFAHEPFEDAWLTGPGIDPDGGLGPAKDLDSQPVDGDTVE